MYGGVDSVVEVGSAATAERRLLQVQVHDNVDRYNEMVNIKKRKELLPKNH
jgi:hypothetical protein